MPEQESDDNEKRIALWPTRNREKGDKHPYLTGRARIDGKDYFVTLWKRERHSNREPLLSGDLSESSDSQLDI